MKAFTSAFPGFCKPLLLFLIWKLTVNSPLPKDRVIKASALRPYDRIRLANQFIFKPSTLKTGSSQRWGFVWKTSGLSLSFQLFIFRCKSLGKWRKLSISPKKRWFEVSVSQIASIGVKKKDRKYKNLIKTRWPLNTLVFLALLPVASFSVWFQLTSPFCWQTFLDLPTYLWNFQGRGECLPQCRHGHSAIAMDE